MVWLVETQTALYEIDMIGGHLIRHRLEGARNNYPQAHLRKDEEPIDIISIESCQVGLSMSMYLDVRKDGTITYRQTTPVVSIKEG